MSEKIRFVAINGPLGVGKSWVANHLESRIAASSRIRIFRVSFQDVLRKAAMNLLGVPNADYDVFKKTDYYGKTGRQWMIDLSESFVKPHRETFFSEVLHDSMRDLMLTVPMGTKNLFIADSWGFESEINYFRAQLDVDTLTCAIEPPGLHERRGLPWVAGDSRYNLAAMASVIAHDSTSMLELLQRALDRRGWI